MAVAEPQGGLLQGGDAETPCEVDAECAKGVGQSEGRGLGLLKI